MAEDSADKSASTSPALAAGAALREQARALFGALPKEISAEGRTVTDAKVALGRLLYSDPRLSKNHDIACATCHSLSGFGVDTRPEALAKGRSPGHRGQLGDRNSPTSFNAALQLAQFWDGRAPDVEAQAKGPVLNPVEMAMPDEASVVKVLKSIPGYQKLFAEAFPGDKDPITYQHMADAIGAFERRLTTPGPFDAWLAGDDGALTAAQKQGLGDFMKAGCPTCHMGPGVGGKIFQKLGLVVPYPTEDLGRFKVTKQASDKFFFKVPMLRNVAQTGPYFHDGSVKTLPEAVKLMSKHQLAGGPLPDDKIRSIVAFLEALTGAPPQDLVAPVTLPESGPKTPKPDPT